MLGPRPVAPAAKALVPPIKCQGIKTKLVPLIRAAIDWDGRGRWIEPFLGSGVVLFNVGPPRACIADTNGHIIRFYRDIAAGLVTPCGVREYLNSEGERLRRGGAAYYYEVRARFNRRPHPLDFLFLNRSCFNGVMRFNRKGEFNVPFGRKTERFRPGHITRIVNQVARVAELMRGRDWAFNVADWRKTLAAVQPGDFVYADPPYFGRHADYFNAWTEADASELVERLRDLPCGFALSTWKGNQFRTNPLLDANIPGARLTTRRHFYHVGPTEDRRHAVEEAIIVRNVP